MRFYIVQPGDTLSKIALRYNTTVAALMHINKLINPELIYPGQVIALPTCTAPCPRLQKGDCDATTAGAVSELQALLNSKSNAGLVIDGLFESSTEKAVKNFQVTRGITPSGIVNLATWAALGINCAPPIPTVPPTCIPTTTPTATATPTPTIAPTPTPPAGFSCQLLGYGYTGGVVIFLQTLLRDNGFPPGALDGVFGQLTLTALSNFQQSRNLIVTGTTTNATWLALGVTCPTVTPTPTVTPSPTPTATVTPPPSPQPALESLWFYVPSQSAWNSLQTHYRLIDVLIPFWYGITPNGEIVDNTESRVLDFAKSKSVPVYGLIHNFHNGSFDPQLIGNILKDPGLRTRLVSNILELVTLYGLAGVNIDFEFVPPDQRNNLTAFMAELYQTLHGAGYAVTIDVPAKTSDAPLNSYSGAFDYANLATYADEVIVLTQDEHYLAFPNPGPIASIPFDRSVLNYAVSQMLASKIKLTIPVYGYDWPADSTGTTVTGSGAILLSQTTGSQIIFDPVNLVPHFSYTLNNVIHEVWFENDVSFAIKIDLAREYRLGGFAVWRLGFENPAVWAVLDTYI